MSNEWYTPSKYIEAAREVMGTIDLDPASCALANETVQATTYYTKEQDGLTLPWHGNVWVNPPYDKPMPWVEKFIQCKQGILLVNPAIDTNWFQLLWEFPICFLKGRIAFFNETTTGAGTKQGSAFIYIGADKQKFRDVFSQFGHVVMPERVLVT